MKIELRAITSIKPYPGNPRITDKAVVAVAASLKEFGWQQPIVVDTKNMIIVGHVRYEAAKKLDMKKVPVLVATKLTPPQIKAYRLADNKTGDLAEWDYDLLPIELASLRDDNYDLTLTGFNEKEIAGLLSHRSDGLTDEDAIPLPPDKALTRRGDVWLCGKHRVMCGDSGNAADVDRLVNGSPMHLVNTDPPYNVKVEPRSAAAIAAGLSSFPPAKKKGKKSKKADNLTHHQKSDVARHGPPPTKSRKMRAKDRPLEGDFVSDAEFATMLRLWFGNIERVLDPGRTFYIWGGYSNIANYPAALVDCHMYFSQMVIWVKEHPVLTRKDFMGNHEWCFYGWKEGAGHKFFGPDNVPDVWSIKKINPAKMVHLTEKPVELALRAIEYSSRNRENVLDLFGGSGSTMIAAERTNRQAFTMEMDPPYCDVIIRRWQEFTGEDATLEGDGRRFAQAAKRSRPRTRK